MDYPEFHTLVTNYLEYLNYFELVSEFNTTDVTQSVTQVIKKSYLQNFSFRITAIIIVSLTYEHQIIPHANRMVKH